MKWYNGLYMESADRAEEYKGGGTGQHGTVCKSIWKVLPGGADSRAAVLLIVWADRG